MHLKINATHKNKKILNKIYYIDKLNINILIKVFHILNNILISMFELSNYIFLNQYSKITYKHFKGIHLFIQKGGVPIFKFGKKGTLHIKNKKRCKYILYISLTKHGIKKHTIKLDPQKLVVKQKKEIELNYRNSLSSDNIPILVSRVNLNPISKYYSYNKSIYKKLSFNFSFNSILKSTLFKLKHRFIKINS